jgi:hypothetical protein
MAYVIHTMMIRCGSGIPTVYAAQVVSCRWTNKALKRWTGKAMRDTGDVLTFPEGDAMHSAGHRAACDKLSREVAARLGMKAGPDVFPFA